MTNIELPNNEFTLVDDDIFALYGSLNWCRNGKDGYVMRYSGKRKVWLHRLILQPAAGKEVDHINTNPLDNTRANLRVVTRSQNCINRRKFQGTEFKHKGVQSWRDKRSGFTRWRARIQFDGRAVFLGYFSTESEAVEAYSSAAKKYHGEYANTVCA